MANFCVFRTTVKLTFVRTDAMSTARFNCRCCCSTTALETLCGPALDVYTIICNSQGLENVDIPILICLGCCEFLKEVHRFRFECQPIDEIFHHNLDIEPFDNDDENSSQINVKTEPVDEHDGIEQTHIQINQMEVDSDSETFQRTFPEGPSVSNKVYSESWPYNSADPNEGMEECHADQEKLQLQRIGEQNPVLLECDNCAFKCRWNHHMIAHQMMHSKEGSTAIMAVDSDQKSIGEKSEEHLVLNGGSVTNEMSLSSHCDTGYESIECSFETKSSQVLENHTASTHSDDKPFKCDQCNYRSKLNRNLLLHKRIHLDDTVNPFKCNLCSFKAITLTQLKEHTARRHTNDRPFSCDQCNYRGKTMRDFQVHKRIHLDNTEKNHFKCNECSFETPYPQVLKNHVARRHSDDRPFSCNQCNYRGKMKSDLLLHKKSHIIETENPYKCTEIPLKTVTLVPPSEPVVVKHVDDKPFSCDQCDYRSKRKHNLLVHKRTHMDEAEKNRFKMKIENMVAAEKRYKCTACSFETQDSQLLKSHAALVHGDDKPFSCDQCDYRSKRKDNLIVHKRTHIDEAVKNGLEINADSMVEVYKYKCTECPFETLYSQVLKNHTARKHSDAKPFSCDQCNYCGKTRSALVMHKKIHLDDIEKRPFKCAECPFRAASSVRLKDHTARIHRDDKPFSCDQCNYQTKTKRDLKLHEMVHQDVEKLFKCSNCSYITTTKRNLRRHVACMRTDENATLQIVTDGTS